LRQSHFEVLEPYVVDALLKRHGLKDSGQYWEENPRRFAEILGVDAVVLSRINRIETSYLLVHSSIEVSVSAHMIDTRSGEILWWAEQTQKDFEGIGKIPTGMAAAVYGPVLFVADRFKVNEMTTKMVHKMTALVRSPEQANQDTRFEQPMIASAWNREAPEGETVHWAKVGPTQQTAPAVPVAGGLNEQLAPPPSELVVETREKTADRTLDEAIASPTFLSAPEPVAGEVQGPRRPSGRVPEGQESQEPGHPSVWF
ncbi:MAG: hypothetical protein GWM98_03820, partial [Nitrospinaceae bacterium]|nr:hypothetical protein [Nitrospinaceae bacterium]NIR53795.1 hypothetical protein [Nitrospinaceae bacterium]NIS84205.1 hypothetical protein [Nitrospinaceae bacterium]NIT81011.1 hypothetical protein [Nitrospinaceae bacterium]NIU43301.1 hypothetical protein [Nitrospinaceae bacterium]